MGVGLHIYEYIEGGNSADTGEGTDTGADADTDAGTDSGADADTDAGTDSGADTGTDAGTDNGAGTGTDAGTDSGADTGTDAGTGSDADTGTDAGTGSDADTGTDAGTDTDTNTGTGENTGSAAGTNAGESTGAAVSTQARTLTTERIEISAQSAPGEPGTEELPAQGGNESTDVPPAQNGDGGAGASAEESPAQGGHYRCAICGFEKDRLEDWELTVEIYMALAGMSPYATATVFQYSGQTETSLLPTTLAELGEFQGTTFPVHNLADLVALQKLSEVFDFKGYTVQFGARQYSDGSTGGRDWDLSPLKKGNNSSSVDFRGLGTEDYPFRGTLTSFYVSNSSNFTTKTPFLNYVAAGATVSQLLINKDSAVAGQDGEPVGMIASHVVECEGEEKVNLYYLTVDGTVTNADGAAGILFGEAVAENHALKFEYTDDDIIELRAGVNAKNAGGIVGIASGDKVEISDRAVEMFSDIYASGASGRKSITGTESAGMFAGTAEGGTLHLDGDRTIQVNVTANGGNNKGYGGGLVGLMQGGTIKRRESGTLTVNGTVQGRYASGGIVGRCENPEETIRLTDVTVGASVQGMSTDRNSGTSVGGVLGQFVTAGTEGSEDGDYHLIDQVKVTNVVHRGRAVGGVLGGVSTHNLRIGDPDGDPASPAVTVSAIVNNTTGTSDSDTARFLGGVMGSACGQYIEVYRANVDGGTNNGNGNLRRAESLGGVIGRVGDETGKSVVKVKDVNVVSRANQNTAHSKYAQGGIFGTVNAGSMAVLDGTANTINFTVNGYPSNDNGACSHYNDSSHRDCFVKTGFIAGEQKEALVYLESGAECQYITENPVRYWHDEIGTYGGFYRNGAWGEGAPIISYAEKDVIGTVGANGAAWALDSEADVMRLAIALNTQGKFAAGCFGGTDKTTLLAAEYQLAGSKVYDLTESGIYSLNRNDATGIQEVFSGTVTGNGATLRLGDLETHQSYLALFPKAGDGAAFQNFTLEGKDGGPRKIKYVREAAAGLAVYGQNNVTVEGVTVNTDIQGMNYTYSPYCYGGMFARFDAAANTVLAVKDCHMKGRLTVNSTGNSLNSIQWAGGLIARYESSATAKIVIDRLSLCQQITSSSRLASGMITRINSSNTNADRTILEISGITVEDGSSLRITDTSGFSGVENAGGGFLGREWFDVAPGDGNFSIKNLIVGTGDGTAPVLENRGTFGGMIHTVTGRLQMVDICVNDVQITGNNTSNDGLLVNSGYDALIEIEGYAMPSPDKVSIRNVRNFSEIVGRNIGNGTGDNGWANYETGGIVNIISAEFKNSSQVYKNRAAGAAGTAESGKVRYYYNLFGESLAGESGFLSGDPLDGGALVVKNADQMLIWHLNQYMKDSIRTRYLAPYFTGAVPAKNGNVTLQGAIDLSNESYYPTPVNGVTINGVGAKVTFDAGTIEAKADPDTGRKPSVQGEHYMMHSGLLLSRAGNVTVQGSGTGAPGDYLTLAGTVANVGKKSGALFTGEIAGNKNIYRIRLEDLYINGFTDSHEHGLMIGKINDGTNMNMSWVETKYTAPAKKAASALIGRVGDPDITGGSGSRNITIEFNNMRVDDKTAGIFKNATFIDQFYYTDDTKVNRGRVRYLFTEAAAKGTTGAAYEPFTNDTLGRNDYAVCGKYLTLGNELQYGIEYWDKEGDVETELLTAAGGAWADYLPYVCDTHEDAKDIEVNPKPKNVLRGCGVYEDPYVIDDPKQLLALARYLLKRDDVKYLADWQINQIGDNTSFCDKTSHTPIPYSTDRTSVNPAFPTQDELRQAYYQIEGHIDLSSLTNTTDRSIAQTFVGLGTTDKPFAGVIVGVEKTKDGTKEAPKVTLPKKKRSNFAANFGLIQYAKGAVVKDLEITGNPDMTDRDTAESLTDCVRVSESAGTVFACVLGGDNIIDGVTVSNRVSPVSAGARVGGYVGVVQQGSLILRGMEETCVERFACLQSGGTASVDPGGYPYVSGLVGQVQNGFVLYEGDKVATQVLGHEKTAVSGVYKHDTLPLSQTYDVIVANASGMRAAKSSPMNIQTGFSCQIQTAAQLQVMSMALNSDAFSICASKEGGYDRQAVCRKAQYDKVGSCTVSDTDYRAAIGKDDETYWYPYIYDYFTFNGTAASASSVGNGFYLTLESDATGYRSQLNAVTKDVAAKMTWTLVDDASKEVDYDLSGYKRAFRGIGATYRVFDAENMERFRVDETKVYSDFRADFDGNGATVRAEMINDYDGEIHTTALFNDLVNLDAKNDYSITDLTVTGKFRAQLAGANNYRSDRTAAVIGMMRRPWTLTDITVKVEDAEPGTDAAGNPVEKAAIEGAGYTAGVVAWINPVLKEGENDTNTTVEKEYTVTRCRVTAAGSGNAQIRTAGGSVGGIVGVMTSGGRETITGLSLAMEDCQAVGTDAANQLKLVNEGAGLLSASNSDLYRYARGRAGGLIGFVGKRTNRDINGGGDYNDASLRFIVNLTIKNEGTASMAVQYAAVDGTDSSGGILGEYYGETLDTIWKNDYSEKLRIEKAGISDSAVSSKDLNEQRRPNGQYPYSFGTGGIVGRVGGQTGCLITESDVLRTDVKAERAATLASGTTLHAGGVVGTLYYGSKLRLSKVTVEGGTNAAGDPVNEVSAVSADAGGLLGRNAYSVSNSSSGRNYTLVEVEKCQVKNMNILSDNRSSEDKTKDKASGTSDYRTGGMVGHVYGATVSVQGWESETDAAPVTDAVVNCVIRTGRGSTGGVIGRVDMGCAYTVAGVSVKDSTVGYNSGLTNAGSGGAGGIIGLVNGSSSHYVTGSLQRVQVEDCDIFGYNTGGLIGNMNYCTQAGNIWKAEADTIRISESRLLGRRVGGAVGYGQNDVDKKCFEHVTVEKNKILALWTEECYAGGFCGYESSDNYGNNDFHCITVNENQIMACNTANTTSMTGQYAGGMFGYITSNRNSQVYAYESALTDNHIGYYPKGIENGCNGSIEGQAQKIHEVLAGMGTGDTAACLLRNGAKVTDMTGITRANLAEYAACFGNLAGGCNQSNNGQHVYFVKPAIRYTSAFDGVRPVVDAGYPKSGTSGTALLNDPYYYRRNMHVIYWEPEKNSAADKWAGVDDVALTSKAGTKEDYLFSQIPAEKIMAAYKAAEPDPITVATPLDLDAYRLNLTIDRGDTLLPASVEDIYSQVYYGKDAENPAQDVYRSPIKVSASAAETLPMVVLDARYGTADQLMNGVLAILTGAGGVLNSGESKAAKDAYYDYGLSQATTITCEAMKIDGGTITKESDSERSLIVTSSNNRKAFAYNGRKFNKVDENGDGTFTMVTIKYGKESYTPLGGEQKHCTPQVEIRIPVFVMERLNIDTYVKLLEGEAFNVEQAKAAEIIDKPLLATDSNYTMYAEYIYGSTRESFSTEAEPLRIEKTVSMTRKDTESKDQVYAFNKGTILTLIDVCDNNKVYYYEVTGKEEKDPVTGLPLPITFSMFEDKDGNPYENKAIHRADGMEIYTGTQEFKSTGINLDNGKEETQTYQEVAVEKFLIVVDVSRAEISEDEQNNGTISDYHLTPVIPENVRSRTTLSEHSPLQVTIQPGPKIEFVDKGTVTQITGSINEKEKLVAEGQFEISADNEYWSRALISPDSIIDSANHGKYLELGLYLTATRDGQTVRIPLPDNTNVTAYMKRKSPSIQDPLYSSEHPNYYSPALELDQNLGGYSSATAVYPYRDGGVKFPLDEVRNWIRQEIAEDVYGQTGNKGTVEFKLELDFELADLTDYLDKEYGVHLELLRADEPKYPAGGECVDDMVQGCPGAKASDLACALEAKDLMELGINTYDNQAKAEETINFLFKLDFTNVWAKNEDTNKKTADKNYTVTYRILEKTNTSGKPVYKPYTGSSLELELESPPGGEVLKKSSSCVGDEVNSRYVWLKLSYDEIKDGTPSADADVPQKERVITRNLKLTVKNAVEMDLTNYKIQASVMVSDPPGVADGTTGGTGDTTGGTGGTGDTTGSADGTGDTTGSADGTGDTTGGTGGTGDAGTTTPVNPDDIDQEVNPVLNDFFVFTIGKLKTDLDY